MLPGADRSMVDRLLDQAAGLVDQVDDEHPWGNACWRTRGYIDIQRTTAYVRMGAYGEAVALCDQILGTTPAPARRDNGVFLAHQATALAALPEPDRVVQIASTSCSRHRRRIGPVASRAQGRRRAGGRVGQQCRPPRTDRDPVGCRMIQRPGANMTPQPLSDDEIAAQLPGAASSRARLSPDVQ